MRQAPIKAQGPSCDLLFTVFCIPGTLAVSYTVFRISPKRVFFPTANRASCLPLAQENSLGELASPSSTLPCARFAVWCLKTRKLRTPVSFAVVAMVPPRRCSTPAGRRLLCAQEACQPSIGDQGRALEDTPSR